jgi:hypothetical protein
MKFSTFSALAVASSGLLGFAPFSHAQTPPEVDPAFVEVVPFTIQWTRTVSSVTFTRTAEVPIPDGDLSTPDPIAPITTETVKTIRDLGPVGQYGDILGQVIQQVGFMLAGDWDFEGQDFVTFDLVAVRAPARSVKEFATNPYRIYATARNRSNGAYLRTPIQLDDVLDEVPPLVPLGMTLTFGEYVQNTTENFDAQGRLTSASGGISTSFRVDYTNTWYPNLPSTTPRHMFLMSARGTAQYTIRTTVKPPLLPSGEQPVFLLPAATTLRGVGYHAHDFFANNPTNYTHLGLAPVSIVIGSAKYLSRQNFPDFTTLVPVTPEVVAFATTSEDDSPAIALLWDDGATESAYVVERQEGAEGEWEEIAELPANFSFYLDEDIEEGVTYSYRVRARNYVGYSEYSNVATPAVEEPEVPEEPAP